MSSPHWNDPEKIRMQTSLFVICATRIKEVQQEWSNALIVNSGCIVLARVWSTMKQKN